MGRRVSHAVAGGLSVLFHIFLVTTLGNALCRPPLARPVAVTVTVGAMQPSQERADAGQIVPVAPPAPVPAPPVGPGPARVPARPEVAMTMPRQRPRDPSSPKAIGADGAEIASATVPAVPPAATAPQTRAATGGDDQAAPRSVPDVAADFMSGAQPEYPPTARRDGLEGTVLLRILVNREGRPASITVRHSSGHGILDEAARRAALDWRFLPARKNSRAITAYHDVRIRFRLDNEK